MDEGIIRLFNKEIGKATLGTKIIGRKIFAYDLVTSTNDLAHFLAKGNEIEGTVLFAKGQTQGRGRFGRRWVSPYGKGLYFSIILRPDIQPQAATRLTLTMALAVACSLEEIHAEGISIKWPNDILIHNKKVCGILTEMNVQDNHVQYMVVGIGVNVNSLKSEIPTEATSLKEAMGREFDIVDLSHIMIGHMDHYYEILLKDRFCDIIHKVKEYSGLILGGRVRVSCEDEDVEGYAVDFDEYGALIIRRDSGLLEKVSSGHLVKIENENRK